MEKYLLEFGGVVLTSVFLSASVHATEVNPSLNQTDKVRQAVALALQTTALQTKTLQTTSSVTQQTLVAQQSGPISDPDTFGVLPQDGDTLDAGSFTVTVDQSFSAGQVSDGEGSLALVGEFVVAAGVTLTVNGDWDATQANTQNVMYAGAHIEFDGGEGITRRYKAAGAHYRYPSLRVDASADNKAFFGLKPSSSASFVYDKHIWYGSNIIGGNVHLHGFSSGYIHDGFNNAPTKACDMPNVLFTSSAQFELRYSADDNASCNWENLTVLSPTVDKAFRTVGSYNTTAQSTLFNMNGLSVDGEVEFYARPEFTMNDWVLRDLANTLPQKGWQDVDSWLLFNADTIGVGSVKTSNIYFRAEKHNPHGFTLGGGYMTDRSLRELDSVVFDFNNLDDGESGDLYLADGAAHAGETVRITNNIALKNLNGNQSNTFVTFNGSYQNGRQVELNNNVVFIPLTNRAISVSEASLTPTNTLSQINNNIFWGDAAKPGYVVGNLNSGSAEDILSSSAYSHNGVFNARSDGEFDELDLPLSYAPEQPIATDAPRFYDDQRRLETYGKEVLGLDGSAETAFNAFITRHLSANDIAQLTLIGGHEAYVDTYQDPTNGSANGSVAVKDMIDWIKQGFVATTTTYHNSGTQMGSLGLQVTPGFTLSDSDGDSVDDMFDQCATTPVGETINSDGCANTQLDDDGDGINNAVDICVETAVGSTVNARGCSAEEIGGALLGFKSWGIGGGGAMAGYSINPFDDTMRFVGTDMGTAFRSLNSGVNWAPIRHAQTTFSPNLGYASAFGFAGAQTVLHAPEGLAPVRSINGGQTFTAPASFEVIYSNDGIFTNDERITAWYTDTDTVGTVYAMSNLGLWRSTDAGDHWDFVYNGGNITGMFIDNHDITYNKVVYIATENEILSSTDGINFVNYFTPNGHKIHRFSGGSTASAKTLTYASDEADDAIDASIAAGLVAGDVIATAPRPSNAGDEITAAMIYVSKNNAGFSQTTQFMGSHLSMAQNDPQTIYATGSRKWGRDKGTSVYVSEDAGSTWALKMLQYNWDAGFTPWDGSKMEHSPVGLNIGWHDGGYYTTGVNQLNSAQYGGSGNYFLYGTENTGNEWLDLTNEYEGTTPDSPVKSDLWSPSGLNVTSVYDLKFNPANSNDIYAAYADIHGARSTDHGATWQILPSSANSIYDYAFNPTDANTIYMVNGTRHDWPYQELTTVAEGGVFKSSNKGDSWERLTPAQSTFDRQYLSLGFHAPSNTLYAGSHSDGIARSTDGGQSWEKFNVGLPSNLNGQTYAMDLVVPQIEVMSNGNVYALVTGIRPQITAQQISDFGLQPNQYITDNSGATTKYYSWINSAQTGIYFLNVVDNATTWTLLRGTVDTASHGSWDADHQPWKRPMSFAVDPNNTNVLWLTDMEHKTFQSGATGIWKSIDNGATWKFMQQHTVPLDINIDPSNSNYVVVAGSVTWRNGGMQVTKDGGETWTQDERPQLQNNGHSVSFDPQHPDKIIYGYSGGGMLYGDKL